VLQIENRCLANARFQDSRIVVPCAVARAGRQTVAPNVIFVLEKREIADVSFIDLAGRYGKKGSRRAYNAEKISVS
jgi:hypothetical protein